MSNWKNRVVVVAVLLAAMAVAVVGVGCTPPVTSGGEASEPAAAAPPELRVSAAMALRGVLEATASEFEAANNVELVFNFGASGQLQRQIENGAPTDVFLSASPVQIDALIAGSLISAEETVTFAGNDLVIAVPAGNPAGISGPEGLRSAPRLTTGNPETAPFGTKAKEWLEGQGLWAELQPRFAFAENIAQALDYVARGEVDAGIVFESEVVGADGVEIAYLVPADQIKPIRFIAAPVADTGSPELASAYLEWLMSESFQQALVDAGFNAASASAE